METTGAEGFWVDTRAGQLLEPPSPAAWPSNSLTTLAQGRALGGTLGNRAEPQAGRQNPNIVI